ncbi:MAG: SRPBCC domain-containing protein [Gemmataceae bacterium]|nr:SRPBCC domain-containing protein [Gemmataceae bacterium]MDW8263768.1 SRPBCC domain-containing protein [Gemmataceae bacterium]
MAIIHLEGEQVVPRAVAAVWDKLRDARFLVQCVPGVERVVKAEPDSAVWIIRPGLAFLRGTLEVSLHIVEARDERALRLHVASKGIGSSSTVEARLTLHDEGQTTCIRWTAEVQELGGLLRALPAGLVQASAQKVIADVWTEVLRHL